MSALRKLALVLLVTLLAVDLAAANALLAVDRTVLNPGFVTSTLEEEDAYEQAEPIVLEQLPTEDFEGAENGSAPLPIDTRAVLSEALDPDYLQSALEPNIERTYAYLHGNREELELVIDLEPAKAAMADAIEAELTNASAAELLRTVAGGEALLAVPLAGVELDLVTAAEMSENESTFRAEREALWETVRDRVVTRAVDRAFTNASNDDLLELVIDDYDSSEYTESEKEALVDDHEAEIRAALRERIEEESSGEIQAEVDDQLAEARASIHANVTDGLNESLGEVPPSVAERTADLVLVAVDGYTADIAHDAYSAEFEAAADDLGAEMAALITAQIDEEVPDRIDVTDQLDPATMRAFEDARRAVGLIDLLSVALPVVGAGLIGLVYLVSGSIPLTAMGSGVGLTIGGLPTLVGAGFVQGLLRDQLAGGEFPAGVGELFVAIAGRVADAVFVQSAVVVGLGVVAFGVGLALHLGWVTLPATVE